jgi:hypothetical protein
MMLLGVQGLTGMSEAHSPTAIHRHTHTGYQRGGGTQHAQAGHTASRLHGLPVAWGARGTSTHLLPGVIHAAELCHLLLAVVEVGAGLGAMQHESCCIIGTGRLFS